MTFIHHKSGKKERVLPTEGETLTISTIQGIIKVESDLTANNTDYEKKYK